MMPVTPQYLSWKGNGFSLPLQDRVLIMGVLNVTPDSFSDGGLYLDPGRETAIARAEEIQSEGADILDLGGESSRPGSTPVSEEEELSRILPVLRAVVKRVTIPISMDTTKAAIARQCLELGACIINDISALRDDPCMASVVADAGAGMILMHRQGEPLTMQNDPCYTDVVREIGDFLQTRLQFAVAAGIAAERIVLDPGIGFGKRIEHNLEILKKLSVFHELGRPIAVGPSRKGFLGSLLGRDVAEREWGTAATVAAAVLQGAHIVRVHAVAQMKEVACVSWAIRQATVSACVPKGGT